MPSRLSVMAFCLTILSISIKIVALLTKNYSSFSPKRKTARHLYYRANHLYSRADHLYSRAGQLYDTAIHLYSRVRHLYDMAIHLYSRARHLHDMANHMYSKARHLHDPPIHLYNALGKLLTYLRGNQFTSSAPRSLAILRESVKR